jgi:hypothetical protein
MNAEIFYLFLSVVQFCVYLFSLVVLSVWTRTLRVKA